MFHIAPYLLGVFTRCTCGPPIQHYDFCFVPDIHQRLLYYWLRVLYLHNYTEVTSFMVGIHGWCTILFIPTPIIPTLCSRFTTAGSGRPWHIHAHCTYVPVCIYMHLCIGTYLCVYVCMWLYSCAFYTALFCAYQYGFLLHSFPLMCPCV